MKKGTNNLSDTNNSLISNFSNSKQKTNQNSLNKQKSISSSTNQGRQNLFNQSANNQTTNPSQKQSKVKQQQQTSTGYNNQQKNQLQNSSKNSTSSLKNHSQTNSIDSSSGQFENFQHSQSKYQKDGITAILDVSPSKNNIMSGNLHNDAHMSKSASKAQESDVKNSKDNKQQNKKPQNNNVIEYDMNNLLRTNNQQQLKSALQQQILSSEVQLNESLNSNTAMKYTGSSKYEQKVMSIDLSQMSNQTGKSGGGNRSLSKRSKNLFDERSTSRERILTKKAGGHAALTKQVSQDGPRGSNFQIMGKEYDCGFGLNVMNNKLQNLQKQQQSKDYFQGTTSSQRFYEGNESKYFDEEEERKTLQQQDTKNNNNDIYYNFQQLANKNNNSQYSQLQSQINNLPFGTDNSNMFQQRGSTNNNFDYQAKRGLVHGNGGMNEDCIIQDQTSKSQSNIHQPRFTYNDFHNNMQSHQQLQNMNGGGPLGSNFFDGLETVSQSVVSNSPDKNNRGQQHNEQRQVQQIHSSQISEYSEEQDSFVDSLHDMKLLNKDKRLTSSRFEQESNLSNNKKSKPIVKGNLDLNLSESGVDHNSDQRSFKTANGSHQQLGFRRRDSDSDFKSALGFSNKKGSRANMGYGMGTDSQLDEFQSAHNDTLNFDTDLGLPRQTYSPERRTNQTLEPILDLLVSKIDVNRNDVNQLTTDVVDFGNLSNIPTGKHQPISSSKIERVKTQITQHVLDKLLYEEVIPSEIEQLAKNVILNYSSLMKQQSNIQHNNSYQSNNSNNIMKSNKNIFSGSLLNKQTHSSQQQMVQIDQVQLAKDSEIIYQEQLLPSVLIGCLQQFFNVTDGSHESQKALRRYVEDELIEKVNFNICSEIWNDCLLIPHVMREDPKVCFDNILYELIEEVAQEGMRDMAHRQTLHSMMQSQSLDYDNLSFMKIIPSSSTYQSEVSSLRPTYQPQQQQSYNQKLSNDSQIMTQYIENTLINNVCNNEVEDLVIQIMQDIIFQQKKLPKIISEEIFDDLIVNELRQTAQQQIKKERLLIKGADNFLQLFINQEIESVIIESIENLKQIPLQLSDEAIDIVFAQITQELLQQSQKQLGFNIAQKQVSSDLIDLQLDKLITSLVQVTCNQVQQEQNMLKSISDNMLTEVVYNSLSDIITESMQSQKSIKYSNDKIIQSKVDQEIVCLVEECINDFINQEVMHEQYDFIIDKIIENDIWRDTVKDLKQEDDAIYQLIEEWTDNYTGQFFIEHFGEIKDEYLRGYKEQMKRVEQKNYSQERQAYQILDSSQKLHTIRSKRSDDSIIHINSLIKEDPYTSMNQTRYHDVLNNSQEFRFQNSHIKQIGANSQNQSYRQDGYAIGNLTKSKLNSSRFQSAKSEAFYDCYELEQQQMMADFDREKLNQLYSEKDFQQNINIDNNKGDLIRIEHLKNDYDFSVNDSVNYQDPNDNGRQSNMTFRSNKDQQFETQSSILDETMQNLEIDEGTRRYPILHRYYKIPEIKSLGFLNNKQKKFSQKQKSMYESNTQRLTQRPTLMLPVDANAIDVLCVNCYECVKYDLVDEHSEQCLKNQQKASTTPNQGNQKEKLAQHIRSLTHQKQLSTGNAIQDNGFPVDLQELLNCDQFESNINLDHSYNFEEGKYILNQPIKHDDARKIKAKEEMEYISELNERIFKLHKAIKQKQSEEQLSGRHSYERNENQMNFRIHLDDIEFLAMNIFTNNTNKKELEINGSDLIDKIRTLNPTDPKGFSLQITTKRLQQLTLQKIQSLAIYQELMEIKDQDLYEVFSNVDDGNMINHTSFQNDNINNGLSRSVSQSPLTFSKHKESQIYMSPQAKNFNFDNNLISEEQFKNIDEEERKQKAELEVWRNLHNEILKNYLMTKGPLVGNRQIYEISSDVSSKNEQISDNTSSYSSMTGASSIHGSAFKYSNFRQSIEQTPKQLSEVQDISGNVINLNHVTFSPSSANKSQQYNIFNEMTQTNTRQPSTQEVSHFTIKQQSNDINMQMQTEQDEIQRQQENEERKRHFYTMAIQNAKKILKIVPQGTILRQLYKKSRELQIEYSDWETFIQMELKKMVK